MLILGSVVIHLKAAIAREVGGADAEPPALPTDSDSAQSRAMQGRILVPILCLKFIEVDLGLQ